MPDYTNSKIYKLVDNTNGRCIINYVCIGIYDKTKSS